MNSSSPYVSLVAGRGDQLIRVIQYVPARPPLTGVLSSTGSVCRARASRISSGVYGCCPWKPLMLMMKWHAAPLEEVDGGQAGLRPADVDEDHGAQGADRQVVPDDQNRRRPRRPTGRTPPVPARRRSPSPRATGVFASSMPSRSSTFRPAEVRVPPASGNHLVDRCATTAAADARPSGDQDRPLQGRVGCRSPARGGGQSRPTRPSLTFCSRSGRGTGDGVRGAWTTRPASSISQSRIVTTLTGRSSSAASSATTIGFAHSRRIPGVLGRGGALGRALHRGHRRDGGEVGAAGRARPPGQREWLYQPAGRVAFAHLTRRCRPRRRCRTRCCRGARRSSSPACSSGTPPRRRPRPGW